MHRRLRPAFATTLLLTLLAGWALQGCGPSRGEGDTTAAAALRDLAQRVHEERRLAAELAAKIARTPDPASAGQLAARRQTIETLADQLGERLVAYLNTHQPVPGQTLGSELRWVLDLKVSEDLAIAEDFITQGGDYAHAIQIYHALLALDPGNPKATAALATAEANRYITAERFAALRKGMSEAEVRTALGPPHLGNIQEFPEQGVVAWFYPKSAEGSAAGVYFQREGAGPLTLYRWDFAVAGVNESPAPPARV